MGISYKMDKKLQFWRWLFQLCSFASGAYAASRGQTKVVKPVKVVF